jgi:hypothetical protein
MVAVAGAGPQPIPYKSLNAKRLADAICFCLTSSAEAAAQGIAEKMKTESGVKAAVESFHANLPLDTMQCDLFPGQPAAWVYEKSSKSIKLSKMAANILIKQSVIKSKHLSV